MSALARQQLNAAPLDYPHPPGEAPDLAVSSAVGLAEVIRNAVRQPDQRG
jgi:hypothetical protein